MEFVRVDEPVEGAFDWLGNVVNAVKDKAGEVVKSVVTKAITGDSKKKTTTTTTTTTTATVTPTIPQPYYPPPPKKQFPIVPVVLAATVPLLIAIPLVIKKRKK